MIQLLKEFNEGVEKIFHISDIHIRLFQRHTEYQYIFEKCYDFIRKYKDGNHIIVVTGDIVHNKNDLSPECDTITIDFLRSLATIFPTLLIAGNHDALLNNRHRMDSITSMLYQRTIPNLYYMKNTGVYEYENILFYVDSLLDDEHLVLKNKKTSSKDKIKIGLFHGQVSGWKNNYGFSTETGDKSLNDFEGLDYVLLGDIHKHQFMKRHDPVVAYAGSLISQNFGESDEDHGVLLWDLVSKTQEFHRLENPYRYQDLVVYPKQGYYLTDKGKYGIKDISAIAPKGQIRISGSDTVDTKLVLNGWKSQLPQSTFHFHQGKVHKKEEDEDDACDKDCEKTIAKDYIRKHTTKETFQDIYHYIMKKWEENDQFYKHVQWDIERIEFSNMFGYGENNKILLSSKEPCTIGIFGENSCGKSTLIEIINILLFDKITRFSHGASIPKEVINFKEMKAKGMIELRIGSDLYRIEKKFDRQPSEKIKTTTKFFHIANGKKSELTGEQRKRTNGLIGEIVGKFDSFIYTNMFLQQRENNFRDMTSAQKKKFLFELFGFHWFEKLEKEKKESLKILEIEYKQQEKNVGNYTHKYWQEKIQQSKKEIEKSADKLEKIKLERKRIQLALKELYCQLESTVDKEEEIEIWKQYNENYEKNMKQYHVDVENAEKVLSSWKDHFIRTISEEDPYYKEWSPCFQKKTLENWNNFFQPFLSQEKSNLVSLNELYKNLSNYPEENINDETLNYFHADEKEDREKWIELYNPLQNEKDLKNLYCRLSHSMEELASDDFFDRKSKDYERQFSEHCSHLKKMEETFDSLSRMNSFWKKHCFDFYWKQHEMFRKDEDYKRYSPTFANCKQWKSFYQKFGSCDKNFNYKEEVEILSSKIKALYEQLPSYTEPVCSSSDYHEKLSWCEKHERCNCKDFFDENWNNHFSKWKDLDQSINIQKMELQLLKENDKLHPYVFNPDCYACNENPFLENKKKNQEKIHKVERELDILLKKKAKCLTYFENHSLLQNDVHFHGDLQMETFEKVSSLKAKCLKDQQQRSIFLNEIQNYNNYQDYFVKKKELSAFEKEHEVTKKKLDLQMCWKEKEMMWKCIAFQRENSEMFLSDSFENTKDHYENFQNLEKEVDGMKEKKIILQTEYEGFKEQWEQDTVTWKKIQTLEAQQAEFLRTEKWLSVMESKKKQQTRHELLKEIQQVEHIQSNSDVWKQHEITLRMIDKIWSDKNLWDVSIQDVNKKCSDAEAILKETDKKIYESKIDMEKKKETHVEKMKQFDRNKTRQESIDQNESLLDELERGFQKYQEMIQKETIQLVSVEKAEKIWKENVDHIEEKKKQIRAEKEILKLLDKDGLPLHLLREKVKQMEHQMNDLISPFLDRKIQFFIDEKNIEFGTVFDKKPICHYFGGMESFILDLSLKLTFSKFSILPRPNFFIIDERISVLDQQRLYNISFLFQFISNLTTNVLLISHIPQVKDFVDKSIEILKENGKSQIRYV